MYPSSSSVVSDGAAADPLRFRFLPLGPAAAAGAARETTVTGIPNAKMSNQNLAVLVWRAAEGRRGERVLSTVEAEGGNCVCQFAGTYGAVRVCQLLPEKAENRGIGHSLDAPLHSLCMHVTIEKSLTRSEKSQEATVVAKVGYGACRTTRISRGVGFRSPVCRLASHGCFSHDPADKKRTKKMGRVGRLHSKDD